MRVSVLYRFFLFVGLLSCQQLSAQASVADKQNMVKSAFLLNVAKFVEWPASVYQSRPSQLVLCHYPNDPLGVGFEVIRNRSVNGREIVKQTVSERQPLKGCDLLYLAANQYSNFFSSDAATTMKGMLVVVDLTQLQRSRVSEALRVYPGVHVTLFRNDDKIAFAVNLQEADRSDLKFSSELLKLSKIVGGH